MVRSFCYGVCMAFIGLRPLAVGTIRASIVEKALVSSLNDKVAMNSDLVGRFSTGGRAGVVYAAGARESSMEAVGRLASVVAFQVICLSSLESGLTPAAVTRRSVAS